MVETIDKKSHFPAPNLRQRQPTRSSSISSIESAPSPFSPVTPTLTFPPAVKARTSGIDTVSASVTNSGATGSGSATNFSQTGTQGMKMGTQGTKKGTQGKGKKKDDEETTEAAPETPRPKVISPELRELLSTKVEVLPRRVVMKDGEGRSSLGR